MCLKQRSEWVIQISIGLHLSTLLPHMEWWANHHLHSSATLYWLHIHHIHMHLYTLCCYTAISTAGVFDQLWHPPILLLWHHISVPDSWDSDTWLKGLFKCLKCHIAFFYNTPQLTSIPKCTPEPSALITGHSVPDVQRGLHFTLEGSHGLFLKLISVVQHWEKDLCSPSVLPPQSFLFGLGNMLLVVVSTKAVWKCTEVITQWKLFLLKRNICHPPWAPASSTL